MELSSNLADEMRMTTSQAKALKRLGILTIQDLIYHFPTRYGDSASRMNIGELTKGDHATVFGKIYNLKTSKAFRKKIPMAEGTIEDDTGKIKIVWFHQAYLAKMVQEGSLVRADGKVSERRGELYMSNPKIETVTKLPTLVGDSLFGQGSDIHTLYPVYSESRGVTSNWIYHSIQKVFKSGILDKLVDPIPDEILKKYNLPNLRTAIIWIHSPHKREDALSARKRFSFEEIFLIQLEKQRNRAKWQSENGFLIKPEEKSLTDFESRFPFPLTDAQQKSINHIITDFASGHPMSRLLEGDVGSGKTAVAAVAAYAVITTRPSGQNFGNLQVAYMAPTEILAKQHFESFIKYFTHTGIQIGLITGSGCRKFPSKVDASGWTDISRSQLLKWVANGEIPILIGTHTLIQKSVKFKHLALVVIDEQHRFGVRQRAELAKKEGVTPHLLSMTATPIPRTLALTLYGDLDLSLLDEMPAGRKQIITQIVLPEKRDEVYEKVRAELSAGRQAYVICPRIDEPDPTKESALLAKSVKSEAEHLGKDVFPEFEIGILHSKMKTADKEEVMDDFKDGKIQILVATSVVEVGVNVENATVIIIEGGERFGLAQLHQLRGRVLRGTKQPYCFVFADSRGEKSVERLGALEKARNGFELAEYDLAQRGAGELYSGKQWGVSDLAMEAIKNIKLVEAARQESQKIIAKDPELKKFPRLKEIVTSEQNQIHFE